MTKKKEERNEFTVNVIEIMCTSEIVEMLLKNEIRIHFHVLMKWNAWFIDMNTWRLA